MYSENGIDKRDLIEYEGGGRYTLRTVNLPV